MLVTFTHNDNHFKVNDYETDKLPNFACSEKTCPFSRDHRGLKLIIFREVEFFRFYCHFCLLLVTCNINRFLFRNNFPERFEFCFIDKQIMQDVFDPVTCKSDFSESIIGITACSRIFFEVRNNRINSHCCRLSI